MFLSHFSYRVSAILLSLATLACQRPAPPIAANPDCSAVMAQQEQQRTDPSVRPSTYDSHSQSDTAAHAVTAVKGCILIKWIHAFDSARGTPPDSLSDLFHAESLTAEDFPLVEWRADGWRRPFAYARDSSGIRVWSLGADGADGTGDEIRFSSPRGTAGQ